MSIKSDNIEDQGYKIHIANEFDMYAIVSQQDVELVKQYKWVRYTNASREHALPTIMTKADNKLIQMHHIILGKPRNNNDVVIHKNKNELDNRRSNIAYVSRKESFTRKYDNLPVNENENLKIHPVCKSYQANRNGEVFNINNNKKVHGSQNSQGYTFLTLQTNEGKKIKYLHVFVYECFYGLVPKGCEIDHINRNKQNNILGNLQCLTIREHRMKTSQGNPDTGRKVGIKLSKAVIAINLKTLKETRYKSLTEASTKLPGTTITKICAVLKGNRKSHQGYDFKYVEVGESLENEQWVSLHNPLFKGIEVSNLGRVKNKRGIISFGMPHQSYMRVSITQNKVAKMVFVHQLVCEAFHGPNPNPSTMTVDHIDRNKTNNKNSNLRWATKSEQSQNRSIVQGIEISDKNGNVIAVYDSMTAASSALEIDPRLIRKRCIEKTLYNNLYYFHYVGN
jgi:hypothetical protein